MKLPRLYTTHRMLGSNKFMKIPQNLNSIFPLFEILKKRSNERSRNEHSYIELTKEGKKEKKENFYY
jgi:hypothetical protein